MPGGFLLARIGVTRATILALLITISGSLTNAFARNYIMLFVGRFIEGVGSSIFLITMFTIVGEVIPKKVRGRAMSLYISTLNIGMIIGPI